MIKIKIEPFIINLLYWVAAAIVLLQAMGIESLISPLFYLSFVLVFGLFIFVLQRKVTVQDVFCLGIVFAAVFCVIVNALITDAPVSFGYFKKLIMFSSTLLYFQTASKIELPENEKKHIKTIINLTVLFLVFKYFTDTAMMYFYNGKVTRYLTFRFTNPNLTALFLICFAIFEIIEFINSKGIRWKLFYGTMSGLLCFFIFETQARNSVIVIVMFFAILLLIRKKHIEYQIIRPLAMLVSIWPLCFSFVYFYILNNDKIIGLFNFLVSKGKQIDSRSIIWKEAFAYIMASPIVGAYNQISGGTGASQLHNTHIDIWASYGIIVLIFVCVLLFKLIYKNGEIYASKTQLLYMIGFCFTIIMGMGEAALFSGGLGIYIFAGIFLLESNVENSAENSSCKQLG